VETEMTLESTAQPSLSEACKRLFALAVPMASTQLISVASSFLCMTMVAKLGTDVLAASALMFSTRLSLMVIGMSILLSLSLLVGHAYGEKNYRLIGNFAQQGWTLSAIISIPLMIIFWYMQPILVFFGQSPSLAKIAQQFFHSNILGVFPFLLAICNQQLCCGVRKQKLDLMANMLGIIVLIVSAYPLILGKWGFPSLGVAGLGIALSLQGWFYVLFTTLIFRYDKFYHRFELFHYRVHYHWEHCIKMLKIGWPICIQMTIEILSLFATTAMIGWISTSGLAAYQIVTQYFYLVIIPLFALAQASGILIGHACGEKKFGEIKTLGSASLLFTLIITTVVALLFLLTPKILAAAYIDVTSNVETTHLAIVFFAVFAIYQIFDGFRNTLTGALRGLFDTKFPMVMGIFSIWVIGIPLSYYLAFIMGYGVFAVPIGLAIGVAVGAFTMAYRWLTLSKIFIERYNIAIDSHVT
jgi:MATE family multidrug resistance protein